LKTKESHSSSQSQWHLYKSWNTKISIQYPIDWKVVENSNGLGFDIFSPDNSFNLGIFRIYQGYTPIYGYSDYRIEDIGKKRIQSMAQNGFSLTSSQLLGNQNGIVSMNFFSNILKNTYNDNIDKDQVVVEFLQHNGDTLFVYYLEGNISQIEKYWYIATKILKTTQFDPEWELQQSKERIQMKNKIQETQIAIQKTQHCLFMMFARGIDDDANKADGFYTKVYDPYCDDTYIEN
jgi:hypothetical protein